MKSVKLTNPGFRCFRPRFVLPVVLLGLLGGSGCGGEKGQVDSDRFSVLGKVMAEKTIPLCEGKGGVVLIVSESDRDQSRPYGIAAEAFRKGLGSALQVVATEFVPTPQVVTRETELFPAEKFTELLQKHAVADCLVSFIGVPALTPAQIAQLPSPRPQVVVVIARNVPPKVLFDKKVISLAALPKLGADQPLSGHTARELFEAQYQVVTP
jgi:hypothetical protein